MSERKQLNGSDWLGIALFAVGSTGAVLMLLSMSTNGPIEAQGPFGPIAAAWKNTLGLFPSLFLNAAIAFLGARLFLEVGARTLVRNLIGCAGLAVALAVTCGAWKIDAGGFVGQRTGAVLSEHTHVAVGTLIGLISFFAVAWFAWFRSSAIAEPAGELSAPVTPVLEKSATRHSARPAVHKTTAANEGVSLAESAALFPEEEDEPVVVKKLTPDEIARASMAPFSAQEIPPSPYPEDVRRKGQIPAGARPLQNPNASSATQSSVPTPSVYRWTAPREGRADDGAGAHLAEAPAAPEREQDEPLVEGRVEREEAAELSALETRLPMTPSWEREPVAFQPEVGDEEPVDAYGTPLTLVEKLRQARRDGGLDRQSAVPVVEGDAIVPREIDADIESAAVQPVSFRALEAQTIDEADAVEFEEEELEETDLFDEAGDDEIVDEEPELEEPEAEQKEIEPVAPAARPAKVVEVQPSLFDAVAEAQPAAPEREIVLQPMHAADVQTRTTKDHVVETDARTKLLSEIGCLFIERGRVAVSMLQRQYEMDFDDACKVLDDLQEMGLIGPYLGGQRRDILLNREQWLERVSQAAASR
jgi:hypothetical protein